MYIHTYHKRVRYGETDQMGYLYYGNYCLLYEIGRVEAIRSLGISYRELEDNLKVMMPVMSVSSRYRRPIRYDENIKIKTILTEMPSKLIVFEHEIFNENGDLAHKGEVKLCFVDMITNKRVSSPPYINEKLIPHFVQKG